MRDIKRFQHCISAIVTLVLFLVLGTACSVKMIAPYDAITDQQTYELQEKVIMQFAEWKREISPIDEYIAFYDEVDTKLTILIERNRQIPKSDFIVGMLERLRTNLVLELKQLHEQDMLNREVIEQIQPDVMSQFVAIQKFQMALKRSENQNTN